MKTKDRILASIYNISQLLTGSASLDRILNRIVRETQKIFGLQRVALFLIDDASGKLECKYLAGFSPEEFKRAQSFPLDIEKHNCRETAAVRTGRTIFISDALTDPLVTETDLKMDRYWKRISTITAPLKLKKRVIGVLEGDRTNERLDLTREEIRLFSIFASQASIIIENARLNEQNQKKIDQLMRLQESTRSTSSVLDFQALLGIIAQSAVAITRSSACHIFLKMSGGLKIAAYEGRQKFARKKFVLGPGQGITGHVFETGTAVLSNNVGDDERYYELVNNTRSQVSVPIINRHKLAGVLTVVSDRAGAFIADDMSLLVILADRLSSVMDNINLYNQIIKERNIAENILESSPNGIITLDKRSRVLSMNRKAEEILNRNRSDVLGRKISSALPGEIIKALDSDNAASSEVRVQGKGGHTLTLGVSSAFLYTDGGDTTGILISLQDLTNIKKTEETIRRMDRLSSLGQLSAGIAHEIRNPLASINFNVQMLAKKANGGEQNIFNDTLAGVERINNLVKGILDFARPRIPDLNPGDINTAIRDSLALMDIHFQKKKIKARMDLGPDLPQITFDNQQIKQVFINILLNAVEAMPAGGELCIKSALEENAGPAGGRISVRFRDNGSGISEKNMARIFDPFFTTKPEGTGLGLSIVHQILNQHNASIDIVSGENAGTEFIITFEADGGRADVPLQNTDSR